MTEFARDEWAWWQKALAEPKKIGLEGGAPLETDADPFMGFYRMRTHRDGPFVPVRIWYSGSTLRCIRGTNEVDETVARGLWSWAARNPISYENYTAFLETGVWFDEVKVGDGDKASSSHVGKPAAEKPERPARPNPETAATASETEAVEQPVEEKPSKDDPDADHRTPEQKAARHENGHDRYDRFGNEVDDWGDIVKPAEAVRAEAAAQQPDESIVEEMAEQQKATDPGPMRYWHHHATDRVFAQPDEPEISGIVVPITEEEYLAIKGTHADQAGFDLSAPAAEPEKKDPPKGGDVKPAPKAEIAAEPAPKGDDEPTAGIGHNSGEDPFSTWKDEMDEWVRTASKLAKEGVAKDEASATKLADTKTKLGDLWKEGEALRKAEKKVHDEAGKAVQAKFLPLLERIGDAGNAMLKNLQPYIDEQQRLENERVAEENRLRREEAEKENARNAAAAADFGDEAPAETVVAKEAKAKNIGVGNRRKVSTVKRKIPVVDNPVDALAYFASQKTLHPKLYDVLKEIGGAAMKAGVTVPGMRLVDESSLR